MQIWVELQIMSTLVNKIILSTDSIMLCCGYNKATYWVLGIYAQSDNFAES